MQKNLIYFGSPDFSAQILEHLLKNKNIRIAGVVTTPDKPQGRKQILTPSAVARLAGKYDLPIYKPEKLDEANLAHIKLLKPDIFLVISYGKLIPVSWLETPTIGTFNIHFSLLPKYRGALCISEAIKNQDKKTGVTLMEMDSKMDHGPIISQKEVDIDINDDVSQLTTKLTQVAKEILDQNLPEICAQNYTKTHQNENAATFTPSHRTVNHSSAFLPFEKIRDAMTGIGSSETHALIRSLNPEPGAWTKINGTEIKILRTSLSGNTLNLELVQIPGKNPIPWKQYLTGHPLS